MIHGISINYDILKIIKNCWSFKIIDHSPKSNC